MILTGLKLSDVIGIKIMKSVILDACQLLLSAHGKLFCDILLYFTYETIPERELYYP